MLTVASSLTADQQFDLYVVTGLPTETFLKNADLRGQIKQALSGTSIFTTDQGKSYHRIVVQGSQVVMEGAGALIYSGETTSTDALVS